MNRLDKLEAEILELIEFNNELILENRALRKQIDRVIDKLIEMGTKSA